MRKIFLLISIVYALATACTGKKQNAQYFESKLDSLNRNSARGIVDTQKVTALTNDIEAYAASNPNDTAAPRLLFNLARAQQANKMYDRSIQTLRLLRKQHPQSEYASKSLVLEGFVNANMTQRYDDAKKAYNEYLEKYSNVDSNLTRDIKLELQTMGKTPDELMQEFEARQKQDSLERLPQ